YTWREERARLISARRATRREQREYEEGDEPGLLLVHLPDVSRGSFRDCRVPVGERPELAPPLRPPGEAQARG
ncbi:MAG: BrnT family toxin, partial [candidate division NC10 bacterium]